MPDSNNGIDVAYVARLACIDLTDAEKVMLQEQLGQVLHYVGQLNELDVERVEPTAHTTPMFNILRADVEGENLSHDAMMKNAPSATDAHVRVPRIIGQ